MSRNKDEKMIKRGGSVDVFGVPLVKRSSSVASLVSTHIYKVQTKTFSTTSELSTQSFNIHVLPDRLVDEVSENKLEATSSLAEIAEFDVVAFQNSRFGLQREKSDIIKENLVAPNNLLDWSPLGDQLQIAGHGSRIGKVVDEKKNDATISLPGIFISSDEGHYILKPLQPPPRGFTEVAFYSHITKSQDPMDMAIAKCIPEFGGVEQFQKDQAEGEVDKEIKYFLNLSNITQGFVLPTIMDVNRCARMACLSTAFATMCSHV